MIKLEVVSEMIGTFEVILPKSPQTDEEKEMVLQEFSKWHLGNGDRYTVIEEK